MRPALIVIGLFLLIFHGTAISIVEFCPDSYADRDLDEYIILEGSGSLDSVTISDGEGGFRFPSGSSIEGRLVIARSSTAYCQTYGIYPDYEWFDYSENVPDVIRGGNLVLGNSNDELILYENNREIQRVRWPDDVRAREGQVHFFENGVWDKRPLFIGQSRFSPAAFDNVTLIAFVSPDSSYDTVIRAIGDAQQDIHLNIYEFSSPGITQALIQAAKKGVNVSVLIEGGPVGGITAEESAALNRLAVDGISVLQMKSTERAHAPYRYDHAKYLVIDGSGVLVTSENFKNSGIPEPEKRGNRGWGVYIQDRGVAEYFDRVFNADSSSGYIEPYSGKGGTLERPNDQAYQIRFPAQMYSGARVTPVLAPDTSYLITDFINSATHEIAIEQAYITNESATALNPYLQAAVDASRRGVTVRILLDSYWFNIEDDVDNDEMARTINDIARTENLPLEARLVNLEKGGFEKVHNKGVIVDRNRVLISSINWNSNSPNFNREAGVIIDQPDVGRYFSDVFESDWASTTETKKYEFDYLKFAAAIAVIVVLSIVLIRRYRK